MILYGREDVRSLDCDVLGFTPRSREVGLQQRSGLGMRFKNAALLIVCLLAATFWLHGGARAQSPLSPPLSLAPPPLDEASPPEPAKNQVSPGVVDPWKTLRRRGMTAKDRQPASKGDRTPTATEDVPQRTGISAQSAAAKNSVPPISAKDTSATAFSNPLPTPSLGKPSQSGNYDGFTVGTDQDEETRQPPPRTGAPSKRTNVRQKHDRSPALQPLDDQAEVEKLKTKLLICRGC